MLQSKDFVSLFFTQVPKDTVVFKGAFIHLNNNKGFPQ